MADTETNAVIVLAVGTPIAVRETVAQIQNGIDGSTSRHIPVITVTDNRGTEHRINVNQIVEFHEPVHYESASF